MTTAYIFTCYLCSVWISINTNSQSLRIVHHFLWNPNSDSKIKTMPTVDNLFTNIRTIKVDKWLSNMECKLTVHSIFSYLWIFTPECMEESGYLGSVWIDSETHSIGVHLYHSRLRHLITKCREVSKQSRFGVTTIISLLNFPSLSNFISIGNV